MFDENHCNTMSRELIRNADTFNSLSNAQQIYLYSVPIGDPTEIFCKLVDSLEMTSLSTSINS